MLSHKSLVACATLILCSFSATNLASAGDSGAASAKSCGTEAPTVIRYSGHPGRSPAYPRRAKQPKQCTQAGKPLMLASFLDAPGGKALFDGNVERASRQIGDRIDSAREQTNLCVLHTLQRNWTDARGACDAAVESAARNRSRVRPMERPKLRQANQVASVAYSNRAVMNWLAGDSGAAFMDLAKARAINPKATFVSRNFEIAVRVPAQLQLPVDPYLIG